MSMNSLVSGILALVMMLTGLCGTMETRGMDHPVTVEVGIGMEGDISPLVTGDSDIPPAALQALINALTFRFSAEAAAARLEVLLNGSPVSFLAVKSQGDGSWAAVSDLFPSTMLTFDKAEAEKSFPDFAFPSVSVTSGSSMDLGQLKELLGPVDFSELEETVKSTFAEVENTLKARFADSESGSFVIGDREYTLKTKCGITLKELAEHVISALKKILSDKNTARVSSLLGEEFSPEALDEALKSIREADESELPALSVTKYSNETGDVCTEVLLEKDAQHMRFLSAVSGSATSFTADILMDESSRMNVTVLVDKENKLFDLVLSFEDQGSAVILKSMLQQGDENGMFSFEVTMPNPAKNEPLTFRFTGKSSHQAPVFSAAEGITVIEMDSLKDDEKAQLTFQSRLGLGLFQIIPKMTLQVPELNEVFASIIQKMMAPQLNTPAQESPAEESPMEESPAEESTTEESPVVEAPAIDGSAA